MRYRENKSSENGQNEAHHKENGKKQGCFNLSRSRNTALGLSFSRSIDIGLYVDSRSKLATLSFSVDALASGLAVALVSTLITP